MAKLQAPHKKDAKGKLAWLPGRKLAAAMYRYKIPTSTWTQDDADKFFQQFPEVSKITRTGLDDKHPLEWYRAKDGTIKSRAAYTVKP